MAEFDSAVGAVLEIPTEALQKISQAEQRIKRLGAVSETIAENVRKDWAITAVSGLQTFIDKIRSTEQELGKLSKDGINLNINTNVAQQSLESLSSQTKKTETDISAVAQQSTKFLDQIDASKPKESFEQLKITFGELEKELNNLISGRKATEVGTTEAQALNNIIASLREYINLQKQSDAEKDKAARKQADDTILKEQRVLLERILQLTKDINAEELKQARYKQLGRTIPQEDINRLEEYKTKLTDTILSYAELNKRIGEMSEKGAKAFNNADIKAQLASTREETKAQEALNQALQQNAKLTSETKLKAPGISSREEAAYASQLVAVYQQMIQLKKMEGDLQAKIAAQGYAQTAAQTDYLNQITAEYRRLESTLTNVSGTYAEIDRVAKSNFERSLTLQEAENANKLADAYQKAAEAAEKKRKAEAKSEQVDLSKDKAEYKKVLALIERLEKAQRKLNQALAQANLPDNLKNQLQSALQASESSLNTLYNRRSQLEAERGNELIEIQRQQEVKKAENAIAEHDKAEKEKTRISKEQAQERYNEEMRQKRLENQDLTAQGKRQRMQINDAKEQRQWEMVRIRREEIERLRREIDALDKTDANYQKNLDRLNQRINELLGTQQRRVQYTAEEARNMAKTATNLSQLEKAYRALKDAMSTLDPKSKEWRELNRLLQEIKPKIDQIKRSMGEFQSQTKRTGDLMDNLKGKIAAAFSIAAISGFIKKVVETRAQFELQRVALGAILQDTDKANKTFLQVQQMALQSPFSIMQLERATKQVAAFGFEADKLLPTMKMLADMSAGLGVEIDRLVLVMGHLKARNYLEGTMVRQFTNAGFNVLGELAKYYSELEGKMVSVAEVQTRVKKKMVEFGDVEEVLKRVTSAGGMFYDMQKKQSDSIWGQMQRITDAYDLMLNEIGKDNQGMISKALSAIRELINHWRMLAPTLKTIGYLMAGIFAVKGIKALILQVNKLGVVIQTLATNWRMVDVASKRAASSMRLAWASTGVGLLVVAATAAIAVFQGLRAEANALNEELDKIGEESVKNLNSSISDYIRLANVVSDVNKTYTEQEEALRDIKRIYAELLPDHMKEREYIKGLNGDYKEVIKTLSEYYQAKEYEQKYETVMGSDASKKVRTQLEKSLLRMNKEGALGLIFSDNQVKAWAEKISSELLSGKIANSVDALGQRIKEIFPDAGDLSSYMSNSWGKADLSDVVDSMSGVADSLENIVVVAGLADNAMLTFMDSFDIGNYDENVRKIKGRIQTLQKQVDNLSNREGSSLFTEKDAENLAKYRNELESLQRQLNAMPEAMANIVQKKLNDEIERQNKLLSADIEKWWDLQMQMKSLALIGEESSGKFKEMATQQKAVAESAEETATKFKTTVPWAMLETVQTSYDLKVVLDSIAYESFPEVSRIAKEELGEAEGAFASIERAAQSFFEKVTSGLSKAFTGLGNKIKQLLGLSEDTEESVESIFSRRAQANAEKFGADIAQINRVMGQIADPEELAKKLRQEAEKWEKDVDSYNKSTNKADWLKSRGISEESVKMMKKNAEAAKALAKEFDGVEKGGKKGKDELAEIWKKRLKAVEDFYKRYEELRKHYDSTESLSRAKDAFQELFDTLELDMNKVISKGMSKQGLADNIKDMTEQVANERPKLVAEFQKAFADTQIQVDFKLKEDSEEDLKRQIEEMFNTYELGKEFTGLGLPVELTMMLGREPIKSPEDLRKKLEEGLARAGGDNAPENIAKQYRDALDKVNDIIFKNQKEQIKNYNKYLIESMGERVQIELKAMQDINKIREDANLDEFSKEQAIMQRRKQLAEELAKFDFDKLKASDIYINTFKDLEGASRQSLQYVIDKLEELKSVNENLSVSQVRALTNEIKKAQEALMQQTSLPDFGKNLKDAVNYARQRKQLVLDQINLQKQLDDNRANLAEEQKILYRLIEERNVLKEGTEEWKKANKTVLMQQMKVSYLENEVKRLGKEVEDVNDKISKGELAWKGVRYAIDKVHSRIKETKDALDSVFDGLDSIGLVNDAFRDTYESISDIVGGLDTILSGFESIDITKPFSIITGSIKAIGGIFQTIGAAFGFGDKKREREIKRLQKSVESLDKAYQKLEKSIEVALTFDQYYAGFNKMQKNLEAQKRAYQEMIALEKDKKKTDDEKLKEYYDALDEIAEREEELRRQRIEDMGSTTDYLSEAQSFVDAWLDAYKETGAGLDALSESWDEFIENLFVKQASAQIVSTRLKGVIDTINKAIEKGKTDIDLKDAVEKAREDWKKEAEIIEPLLEQLFGAYGLGKGNGEYVLSDLQKGIQNITEPQAAAIEAYLNSIRFEVFRRGEQIDSLIATIQAQYGGGDSPMLQEVRLIRNLVDSINTQLGRVIVSKNANTNYVLKVG